MSTKQKLSNPQISLKALYESGPLGINSFEAKAKYGVVMSETVQSIQKYHGVHVQRERERAPNPKRNGRISTVTRYYLLSGHMIQAYEMLIGWGVYTKSR